MDCRAWRYHRGGQSTRRARAFEARMIVVLPIATPNRALQRIGAFIKCSAAGQSGSALEQVRRARRGGCRHAAAELGSQAGARTQPRRRSLCSCRVFDARHRRALVVAMARFLPRETSLGTSPGSCSASILMVSTIYGRRTKQIPRARRGDDCSDHYHQPSRYSVLPKLLCIESSVWIVKADL